MENMGKPLLEKTNKVARGVSGKKLNSKGIFTGKISFIGKILKLSLYVTEHFKSVWDRLDCLIQFMETTHKFFS